MLLKTYRQFNNRNHDQLVELFDGVEGTLKALKQKGYTLGIVTSKIKNTCIRGLDLFDLKDYFNVIVGMEDTKKHKPNPQPILKALDKLNVKGKENIFYVGDSPFDINAARRAGVIPIGVNWSVRLLELKELQPYVIIDKLPQLTEVIEHKRRAGVK